MSWISARPYLLLSHYIHLSFRVSFVILGGGVVREWCLGYEHGARIIDQRAPSF